MLQIGEIEVLKHALNYLKVMFYILDMYLTKNE